MSTSTFALLLGIACLGIVLAAMWSAFRPGGLSPTARGERRRSDADRRRFSKQMTTDRRTADRRRLPLAAGF